MERRETALFREHVQRAKNADILENVEVLIMVIHFIITNWGGIRIRLGSNLQIL